MTQAMVLDTDDDWPVDAELAIYRLAITEEEFTADQLRHVLRPAPDPHWVGLAFTHAQRAGVIEWVRYVRSNNKTRRGGSVSVWRRKVTEGVEAA